MSVEPKRALLAPVHLQLSSRRPCVGRGVARSTLDDQPWGERAEHRQRMRWRDEPYTATPLYGVRRMTAWLRGQGSVVNRQRVARLRHRMGLQALDPNPRRSQPAAGPTIDPSLWRGVTVERVNQGWRAAITDICLQAGFVSLVAVMDGFSRSVWSWALAITRDLSLCVEALEQALGHGGPEMFHTDQGVQCTSQAFTARLKPGGIRLRMASRGRALDHVCVER
jgi:putative transposase